MNAAAVASALRPYLTAPFPADCDPDSLYIKLAAYLDVLLKWNARTNLTAIRTPEEIVRRHFGESLFAGLHLGDCATLLDFGSGAGFPGIPVQLLHPHLRVTLAESQGKKAAFLREAVRALELDTEVWSGRVEAMDPAHRFDVITLRAVDKMQSAVEAAAARANQRMMILSSSSTAESRWCASGFELLHHIPLPESENGVLEVLQRIA